MSQKTKSASLSRKLVESAIMVAVATVLSLIKILDLPYGGSVTLASMLPVIIIAYRHGTGWGLITGTVYAIIQQLLGLKTLSYVTSWQSIVAVIMLDYIVAFMVTGLGGIFRKTVKSQSLGLLYGSLFVCVLRYICHVISGATVWAGLSIPTNAALIYSLGYNATYMIPETIVTAVVAYYVGSMIDFRSDSIYRFKTSEKYGLPVLKWIGGLVITGVVIFDAVKVFSVLQNPEKGDFDITGLSNAPWLLIGIVTGVAVIAAVVLFIISVQKEKKN